MGDMNGHVWQFTVSGVTEQGAAQTAYCLACHYTRVVFVPHGTGLLWDLPTWSCPGEPPQYQRGSHLMTWPPPGTKRTDDGTGDTETWEPA